jgi:hypothetical protein
MSIEGDNLNPQQIASLIFGGSPAEPQPEPQPTVESEPEQRNLGPQSSTSTESEAEQQLEQVTPDLATLAGLALEQQQREQQTDEQIAREHTALISNMLTGYDRAKAAASPLA